MTLQACTVDPTYAPTQQLTLHNDTGAIVTAWGLCVSAGSGAAPPSPPHPPTPTPPHPPTPTPPTPPVPRGPFVVDVSVAPTPWHKSWEECIGSSHLGMGQHTSLRALPVEWGRHPAAASAWPPSYAREFARSHALRHGWGLPSRPTVSAGAVHGRKAPQPPRRPEVACAPAHGGVRARGETIPRARTHGGRRGNVRYPSARCCSCLHRGRHTPSDVGWRVPPTLTGMCADRVLAMC